MLGESWDEEGNHHCACWENWATWKGQPEIRWPQEEHRLPVGKFILSAVFFPNPLNRFYFRECRIRAKLAVVIIIPICPQETSSRLVPQPPVAATLLCGQALGSQSLCPDLKCKGL